MSAQAPQEPVDLERIVRDAIARSGLRVHESAERAIVQTGRQEEDVLADELRASTLSEADIVSGLVELLEVAQGVAREQGEDEIRDTTMEEAMRRRCPIKPWC
ncbi:MAG TPA: hypothetical protein VN960_06460 [Gaiellaceae bacterium]|nr:hypothetical protein [Gaiellaceae bacterium]